MSTPPDAERSPLQAWLDITEDGNAAQPAEPADRPRVSRRLLVATGLACVVAVALAAVASRVPGRAAQPGPVATLAAQSSEDPTGADAPAADEPPDTTDTLQATTAAVLAVRLHVPPDIYVDTALPDAVTSAGASTIVTVRAIVLPRTAQGWGTPRPARYAVAVGAGAAILGGPWPLPADGATPPAPGPTWQPAPDLRTAATAALRAAGYRRPGALDVRRSPDLDGIVSVRCTALAPDEPTARRHDVWLTSDAASVLGAAASMARLPLPLEQP